MVKVVCYSFRVEIPLADPPGGLSGYLRRSSGRDIDGCMKYLNRLLPRCEKILKNREAAKACVECLEVLQFAKDCGGKLAVAGYGYTCPNIYLVFSFENLETAKAFFAKITKCPNVICS